VLDDDAIARYARQIVVPDIGAAGQEKLLASTVLLAGNARGCSQAALYLHTAGVRIVRSTESDCDIVLVADATALDEPTSRALLQLRKPICWYAADEHGFRSGVHPAARLPSLPPVGGKSNAHASAAVHDAAACDVASVACAILLGLDWRSGPFHFEA